MFEAVAEEHSEEKLKRLSDFVHTLTNLDAEIETMEAALKEKTDEHKRIESSELPELMDDLRVTTIGVTLKVNGEETVYMVSLDAITKASLPTNTAMNQKGDNAIVLRQKHSDGLKFLRDNGADHMIKNQIEVNLAKDEFADKLADDIMEMLKPLNVSTQRIESVHTGSLTKYVKERMEDGLDLPDEAFSIYTGRKVKIKIDKKRR